MTRNCYIWYLWCTLFLNGVSMICNIFESGICAILMTGILPIIYNIFLLYPWREISISGIHDTQLIYLSLDYGADFMYRPSHPNKFSTIKLVMILEHWAICHCHVLKCVTTTRLCPAPWTDWAPCQIWWRSVRKWDLHACGKTQTYEQTHRQTGQAHE